MQTVADNRAAFQAKYF